jgi:hypothetical protein
VREYTDHRTSFDLAVPRSLKLADSLTPRCETRV